MSQDSQFIEGLDRFIQKKKDALHNVDVEEKCLKEMEDHLVECKKKKWYESNPDKPDSLIDAEIMLKLRDRDYVFDTKFAIELMELYREVTGEYWEDKT